ncbi:Transposase [Psychroflexus sediminis]|uniref:Transposase n=1 Tax=Psychroflexus sediminis TaxID=470826 RepID=A0A1G7UR75_9FLAO|nr:transposase [Psychroflexus sediminis]SDG50125.1 Transposase [Psychroflexus sediminis]
MKTELSAELKLYIGIDIHKRSWKVHCATDLFSGKTFSIKPYPEELHKYVTKHFPGYEVTTAYIHRKGKERFTKTDKIDAQLISRELKDGRLKSIPIPDKEREELRSLFRRRNDLVKDYRRIKSLIKMQLLYYGIHIPEEHDNDHWSHKFREWIDELKFEYSTGKESLESKMRSFRFIDKELREVSNQLRAYCRKHYKKDYYLLRSIPGIGGIVACGILSELGDLRRFNSLKHLLAMWALHQGYTKADPVIKLWA